MRRSLVLPAALLAAGALHAAPASADTPAAAMVLSSSGDESDLSSPQRGKRYAQRGWTLSGGIRNTVVTSDGLDPYSDIDVFPQGSVGVSYVFWRPKSVTLALAGGWDGGTQRAQARGLSAEITSHRLSLGLIARAPIVSHLDAFIHLAGDAVHVRGSIEEQSAGAPLVSRSWTWGLDTMGGASILIGSAGGHPAAPLARFWIDLEAGYAFSGEARMAFRPDVSDDDPRRYGEVELPGLRLSGFSTRASLAMSF